MSMFNKEGVEFKHVICVKSDNKVDPTYSYKFPVLERGRVVEKWARKVRPIKDLTGALRGCQLKRYKDYMIEYGDLKPGYYSYWFLDAKVATMFALVAGTMKQTVKAPNSKFDIVCPHCANTIKTEDITWI